MDTLSQLSSRNGDRTSASNRAVADRCIAQPALLVEVAAGLDLGDAGVAADCAEVFTMVAENRPEYVAPYADRLTALLSHNNTHARWEATHAIALVAANSPEAIALKLPRLAEMICKDASIIVRDYAVDAVAGYAQSSPVAARQAYPILREALTVGTASTLTTRCAVWRTPSRMRQS